MSLPTFQLVDVFPISTGAFGFEIDWFEDAASKMIDPAYLLMVLLLVVAVGIMVLQRFQHADLEKKAWNIPIIIVLVVFWPGIVLGLKKIIDTFNTFLVRNIFQIPWEGFGFPEMGGVSHIFGWTAENLARLLPNLAYWVIYAFFMTFFFFYAVLGPLIFAKGILTDEIDAFLEVIKELTVLFLWQTTMVVLVAFIMPEIVSGKPFPSNPESNFYFLSLILGIMIFFAPSLSRKFGNHLGSSFFPPGVLWYGIRSSFVGAMKTGSLGVAAAGFGLPQAGPAMRSFRSGLLRTGELTHVNRLMRHGQELEQKDNLLEKRLYQINDEYGGPFERWEWKTRTERAADRLLDYAQKAKYETDDENFRKG